MPPELETGTPAEGSAAPQDTSSASPTFETDTPSQGSDSTATGGTDEMATLRSEVEELRKRVSHGSRTAQELQQTRDALKQQEERLAYWRQNGVDPDEIDRALKAARGDQSPVQTQQTIPANTMTHEQFNQMMVLRDWEAEKKGWFNKNPEFNTKIVSRGFDGAARDLAEDELREFGRVVSTPEELFKKVVQDFNKFHSAVEKKTMQKTTETRTKVAGQGVVETGNAKPNVDRKSDDDYKAETGDEYIARLNSQQRRLRGIGK